jgi:hypothetical protein
MNSLWIDLILCSAAYLVSIYFVVTLLNRSKKPRKNSEDDGEGGVVNEDPPIIDLPPGVIWSVDEGSKTKTEQKSVKV